MADRVFEVKKGKMQKEGVRKEHFSPPIVAPQVVLALHPLLLHSVQVVLSFLRRQKGVLKDCFFRRTYIK